MRNLILSFLLVLPLQAGDPWSKRDVAMEVVYQLPAQDDIAICPRPSDRTRAVDRRPTAPIARKWYQANGVVPSGATPFQIEYSITGGHWHMNYLEARTKEWTGALAAYNWGRLDRIRKAQTQAELMGFSAKEWPRFLKIPAETAGYIDRIPRVHVPWVKEKIK